ncbi:DUF3318 domain-containing protein [Floridanema aerugineum]|jgi:hypothetical protein|uniref:DUF3318 domain-containing protein n=1 Tax=Floridaenema aerugineum BLCC-F46 TaxID=3153654 RepID=A0ABV4WZD4_9CYAN
MEPKTEISRLLDIMPASGRMMCKIISKPEQKTVIESPLPLPWTGTREIWINFDLWSRLSLQQRDLLLLRTVSWLIGIKWFKPDVYQGLVVASLLGGVFELVQRDVVGVVVAGGLTALASRQIWRSNRNSQTQLSADEAAIKVAIRRGYSETEAAQSLIRAIDAVAQIEGRSTLDFMELLRRQNLRAIANLSPIGVPETIKKD